MFSITVAEKGGSSQQLSFDKAEVTIGRLSGNDIVLAKGNVSKVHSRLVIKDGKFILVDMKSTNGTYVNGKKIAAPQVIRPTDKIYIGDYILNVESAIAVARPASQRPGQLERADPAAQVDADDVDAPEVIADAGPSSDRLDGSEEAGHKDADGRERLREEAQRPFAPATSEEGPERDAPSQLTARVSAASATAPARTGERLDATLERSARLQRQVLDRLSERLDLRRMDRERLSDPELRRRVENAVEEILEQLAMDGELSDEVDRGELLTDVLNEALGLGPLETFLASEDVSQVMVNHAHQIYIEKKGKLLLTGKTFSSNQAVLGALERILAPIGGRLDETSPLVDARLKDGTRVHAILPPLAPKGPCLTLRKLNRRALRLEDLVRQKALSSAMAEFLKVCVVARRNLIISGGTGAGKTTYLNVLSSLIPENERIVSVEETAELQLPQEHWVQLEARTLAGKPEISIRDLVKNCLRMRPDRIVVGECRGGEALHVLEGMNTDQPGSLTTVHATSPRDALARLEMMMRMGGMDIPAKAIREQIANAVNIICQQTRFSDGTRKMSSITEISGMDADTIALHDVFYFKQEGVTDEGGVRGRFVASGFVPRFYAELQRGGVPVNLGIFREE